MTETLTPPTQTAPRQAPPATPPPRRAGARAEGAPAARPGAYMWIAAGICMFGMIMAILDQTVVNVALPRLETDFKTSLSTIQWIITGYSLSLAAVIPLSAWLGDRLSTKWVFIASELMFIGGSALCGLAQSDIELIIFRVIQGLGGGLLMPVGMTILMRVSPPDTRGRMMAVLGIPMMLGPIAGPLLGGWFVQAFTWRLIFYINVPIGLVGAVLGTFFLRPDGTRQGARYPLDVVGLILVMPAMVGIVYGLSEPNQYGWGSFQVLGPMIGGAVLLVVFIFWELRQRYPLLNLRVFGDRGYSGAQILVFLVASTLFGAVFLMPLFMQQVQGMGTLKSGFILAFQGIAAAVMMPISGILTDRIGARKIVPFGVVVLTAGSLWTSTLSWNTSEGVLILMMASRGIGMGLTMMPAMSAAYVTLRPEVVAAATSITNVVQRVAAALGVAVLSTILTNRILANMPHIPGHSLGGSTANLATLNLPPEIKDIILKQATNGFNATFLVAAGLGVLCLPASLLLQRARSTKEVRDYAVGQLRQGVTLGAAALRVRDGAEGRLSEEATEGAFNALARSGKARIEKGALLLRLGSNAGGLLPKTPMSPALKAAVGVAAVVGLAATVIGFVHAFQTPDVPNILPLLAQLQHH